MALEHYSFVASLRNEYKEEEEDSCASILGPRTSPSIKEERSPSPLLDPWETVFTERERDSGEEDSLPFLIPFIEIPKQENPTASSGNDDDDDDDDDTVSSLDSAKTRFVSNSILKRSTALHTEALKGKTDRVASLIQQGNDVNARDHDGNTPLHVAIVFRQYEVARLLLQEEEAIDLNAENNFGATPLYEAVLHGSSDMVNLLIENGADTSSRAMLLQGFGQTLLHLAAFRGHVHLVKLLVDKGLNPKERDATGCLPLHLFCRYFGSWNMQSTDVLSVKGGLKALEILSNDGKLVKEVDSNQRTPLHFACLSSCPQYVTVNWILAKNPNAVNVPDDQGFLPLHLACKQKRLSMAVLRRLVQHLMTIEPEMRSQKNSSDRERVDSFNVVCEFLETIPFTEVVARRRKILSDVFSVADGGSSLETLGSSSGMPSTATGASTTKVRNCSDSREEVVVVDGLDRVRLYQPHQVETPVWLTVLYGCNSPDMIGYLDGIFPDLLIEDAWLSVSDEERYKLHAAIKYNDRITFVEALNSIPDGISTIDSKGRSALDFAALNGNKEFFALLEERGAVSNRVDLESDLRNLLEMRARHLQRPCLRHAKRLFLFKDTELSHSDAQTLPLHFAIQNCDFDKFRVLLRDKTTNLNSPSSAGYSPLDFAAVWGRRKFVDSLLDLGAQSSIFPSIGALQSILDQREPHAFDQTLRNQKKLTKKTTSQPRLDRLLQATLIFRDALLSQQDTTNLVLRRLVYARNSRGLSFHLDMVQTTPSEVANVNSVDSTGRTPLDLAALSGQRHIFEILLRHGAKPSLFLSTASATHILRARERYSNEFQWLISEIHKG